MFPQLFESVPDALVIVDRGGRIVQANANAERLFGYARGALDGLEVEVLIPEDVHERHRAYRGSYMQRPRVRPMGGANMTLVGVRRDGQAFPVEIALSPLEDDDGAHHYLASVRDISETQRARQAFARSRYDAVVARIGQLALASTNDDSAIEHVPELVADVLEVPTVAVVVMRGAEPLVRAQVGMGHAAPGEPSWLMLDDGPLQRVLASGQPLVVQRADDADAPAGWPANALSGAIVPLLDRERPLGAVLALSRHAHRFDHDSLQLLQNAANLVSALMQRRRSEEQLAHAQRLDAIGQLTGGVAHDFNNLLTVVSGSLQLLDAECGDQPQVHDIINSALRSVERGSELTSKLLAFARRQHLSPRALQPAALLGDLERMLRSTLGAAIRLRIDCPAGLPSTYVDPSQLDTALLNLALNARDATPQGGEIAIAASERHVVADPTRPEQRAGHYVAFSVADTGRGMTADVLARAFEPFFTTKPIGRGSGLGLSMVYGFVKQSGGHLRIDSQPGYGTQVELFLPVAEPGQAVVDPRSDVPEARGSELVLVVEDEADVRNIAEAFLRSLGYHVIGVGTADEALRHIAAREDIALLFSDVMLGAGMNGMELAQAVRARWPRLGVLLTSGYDDLTAKTDSSPGFELLRKPYRRDQLAAALRRNLPPQESRVKA